MAERSVYRTYRFIDKDPVIDQIRTILQDQKLMARMKLVTELSGVSASTLHNWFEGDTKRPQHATIGAVTSSLGYTMQFVQTEKLDLEKERKKAADFLLRQNSGQKKRAAKKHRNGSKR